MVELTLLALKQQKEHLYIIAKRKKQNKWVKWLIKKYNSLYVEKINLYIVLGGKLLLVNKLKWSGSAKNLIYGVVNGRKSIVYLILDIIVKLLFYQKV